uniref:Tropomodulin n=1 Tax=Steinernema glaseri TaxID=37863 RepID=A0A1I7YYL8_9BILA
MMLAIARGARFVCFSRNSPAHLDLLVDVLLQFAVALFSCQRYWEYRSLKYDPIRPEAMPMIPIASSYSYYAEEKTFAAPGAARKTPAGTRGAGVKLYGRDLRDYDDNDLENLLSKLTVEELEDLNNDFDPDNSLLPPSQRCRNQTDKEPTGPFQREKLLKFLEETAKNEADWEEAVPFSPGQKRGKVYQNKEDEEQGAGDDEPVDSLGRKLKDMEMPIEVDLDDDEDEEDIDDEKFEKALDHAPERDLVDLAGILGMHNILNQKQYYNALKGKTQDDSTGTSFSGIVKAFEPNVIPDEPINQTNVDECIKRLEEDDEELTEVNINNMAVSRERIRNLIKAATSSAHLEKLCMAGVEMKDSEARGLVELLETSPSLKTLNVESNDISPEMLAKLLRATLTTQVLTRFHADNQRASVLGNQIEMDMMLSIEENDSLLRVGIAFQSMEARHRVSEALERNLERVRLRRLENTSQA